MNKNGLIFILILSVIAFFIGCPIDEEIIKSSFIEGLTLDNYPKVDGSTSTAPLNAIIACKLLGINYTWEGTGTIKDRIMSIKPNISKNNTKKFNRRIISSQTHNSFINLIDKKADLILSARKMSPDEKAYANNAGINLIETPIALDAFIFIVNLDNPVQSLTIKQIQDIYTGKIKNWKEVGVNDADWNFLYNDAEIKPFIRNSNSGSQELMEILVMNGLETIELPENNFELIFSMVGALDEVSNNQNSICYSVYYYKEFIASGGSTVKSIAVEGIPPTYSTISDRSYPYTAEIYAVIRSDLSESSMAFKAYEWIQTESGRAAIAESKYILN